MDEPIVLSRHSEPSALDMAPYKSLCRVDIPHTSCYELYVQSSKNENEPVWLKIDTINKAKDPQEFYESIRHLE